MNKYLFLLFSLLAVIGVSSCDMGPAGPTEADLISLMSGTYCSGDSQHRLELSKDGHYTNKRLKRNPFGGSSLPESCEGTYQFVETDGVWKLVFNKSDKKSNPMIKTCKAEFKIWDEEAGYVLGDSVILLEDLFDGTSLSNMNCGK